VPTVPGGSVSPRPGSCGGGSADYAGQTGCRVPPHRRSSGILPSAFRCSREHSGAQMLLNGPFISDKRPIINALWCGLMLMSDAECGSVLSSDVCVAFSYRQEFAGNL